MRRHASLKGRPKHSDSKSVRSFGRFVSHLMAFLCWHRSYEQPRNHVDTMSLPGRRKISRSPNGTLNRNAYPKRYPRVEMEQTPFRMQLQKSSTTAAMEHIAMHEIDERKQRRSRGKQRHADSPAREVKGGTLVRGHHDIDIVDLKTIGGSPSAFQELIHTEKRLVLRSSVIMLGTGGGETTPCPMWSSRRAETTR